MYTVEKRYALGLALHTMPSVEMDHIPLTERKLQAHRRDLSEPYALASGIYDLGSAGYNIELVKNSVVKAYPDIYGGIYQGDYQGLSL